jgi:hypothetical protein
MPFNNTCYIQTFPNTECHAEGRSHGIRMHFEKGQAAPARLTVFPVKASHVKDGIVIA